MLNIIEVSDLAMQELKVYACRTEVPLFRCFEPDPGVFVAETPKVIERAVNAGFSPRSFLVETKYLEENDNPHGVHVRKVLSRCEGVPVYTANQDFLRSLLGYPLPGGMLCCFDRRVLPTVEKVCENAKRIVILENITNPANLGSVFRSAAALNMDAVILSRHCTDPFYRRADRVSMGTVFQIPWTYFDKKTSYPGGAFKQLRELGFKTAAMVLSDDSVNIDDEKLMSEDKLAIVLGNEGEGLTEAAVNECDYKVCIPMSHDVDSLNVAVAAAIAFWQLGKKENIKN